jgi:hypothetical protein
MKPLDISNEIENIRPAQSAVLTLLMGLGKVTVDSRTFLINQQDIDPGYVTMIGAAAGDVITVSADDIKLVRAGQTIRLNASVCTWIKSVTYAGPTFVVDDVTSLVAGSVLILGSTASEELSSRPTAISRQPVQTTNYCETLRDSYGQSRWVETEKHYGGSRAFHNRDLCLWEHKRFIDRGIWFNEIDTGTINSQAVYKTNGIFASITTNVTAFAGSAITWAKMRTNITNHTRFSLSPNLWLAVSRKGLELIEGIIYAKTTPAVFSEAQQIKVLNLGMGNKTLKIFVIDHFEQGLLGTMALLDPEMIEIVTTKDQKTGTRQWMLERKFDGNDTTGTDGTIGEVLTDFGVRLHNEKAHAIWTGADA